MRQRRRLRRHLRRHRLRRQLRRRPRTTPPSTTSCSASVRRSRPSSSRASRRGTRTASRSGTSFGGGRLFISDTGAPDAGAVALFAAKPEQGRRGVRLARHGDPRCATHTRAADHGGGGIRQSSETACRLHAAGKPPTCASTQPTLLPTRLPSQLAEARARLPRAREEVRAAIAARGNRGADLLPRARQSRACLRELRRQAGRQKGRLG